MVPVLTRDHICRRPFHLAIYCLTTLFDIFRQVSFVPLYSNTVQHFGTSSYCKSYNLVIITYSLCTNITTNLEGHFTLQCLLSYNLFSCIPSGKTHYSYLCTVQHVGTSSYWKSYNLVIITWFLCEHVTTIMQEDISPWTCPTTLFDFFRQDAILLPLYCTVIQFNILVAESQKELLSKLSEHSSCVKIWPHKMYDMLEAISTCNSNNCVTTVLDLFQQDAQLLPLYSNAVQFVGIKRYWNSYLVWSRCHSIDPV